MIVKDLETGKLVKIISFGPTETTLKVIHSDGTIKVQERSQLEISIELKK